MAKKTPAKKTTETAPAKKAATKKAPVKKAIVVKKAAEKKSETAAPAKKAAAKKSVAKATKKSASNKASGVTKVVAKVDVGWGNSLYIRGEGSGLSWDQGILMSCESGNEWAWMGKGAIAFKVLINDEIWANGEDVKVASGKTYTFTPTF